jgi:hypothetical protein
VVKAASLAHGVRRGLAPATRNRIRFEMKQRYAARASSGGPTSRPPSATCTRVSARAGADDEGLMRRGLWFVAGAGAGSTRWSVRRRVARRSPPRASSDRWHALTLGARMFRDEVAQGQAEAETELRERFGLVPHGRRAGRDAVRGLDSRRRRRPTTGAVDTLDHEEGDD